MTEDNYKNYWEKLEQNVQAYIDLKEKIEELTQQQDYLKADNLTLMQMLGIEDTEFSEIGLRIQVIKPMLSESVDESRLIELVGEDKVKGLRIVPVKAVEGAVKSKILVKEAIDCIIKKPGKVYTKVSKI